jgi:hypothetical protein
MTTQNVTFYDSITANKFNDGKEYYTISNKNIVYIGTFPIEWALNHEEDSGPECCSNCHSYGSINGVFIGYCMNCALYVYEGKRGYGFIDNGIEDLEDDFIENGGISAFTSYLKNVDIDCIHINNIDIQIDNNNCYTIETEDDENTSDDD